MPRHNLAWTDRGDVLPIRNLAQRKEQPIMNVQRKYGLLRAIAFILKLLAWLVLVAGIIGGLAGLLGGSAFARNVNLPEALPLIGSAGLMFVCVIWFVQLFAFGSILSLLIDIEENTRAMAASEASG